MLNYFCFFYQSMTAVCVTVVSEYLYFEFNNVIAAQLMASQEELSSVKLV
jgi:hypothetical protein